MSFKKEVAATFAALLMALGAPAAVVPNLEHVHYRLETVEILITKSSGARQVEESTDPQAHTLRNRARTLHARAGEAYRKGDAAGAMRFLDEAAQSMFQAVRLSDAGQTAEDKKRHDFAARRESVEALLEAQKRIGREKGATSKQTAKVEQLLQRADALAAEQNMDRARETLEQAYLAAKSAIGGLRGGDTLVRTLKFDNKKDEYYYEIDRNDTHRMLVKMLAEESRAAGGADALVRQFTEQAAGWREKAERAAAQQDYAEGIRMLEESTRALVRAIRAAGLYIPG